MLLVVIIFRKTAPLFGIQCEAIVASDMNLSIPNFRVIHVLLLPSIMVSFPDMQLLPSVGLVVVVGSSVVVANEHVVEG